MAFNWVSPSELRKQLVAKDAEIATLKDQLDAKLENASAEKLTALFGDAAKAEDFDLEAAVAAVIAEATTLDEANVQLTTDLEAANASLTAANGRLDAVAKLLGHASAKDVDLAAEIAAIQPEEKTTPNSIKDKKVTTVGDYSEFRSEMDDQFEADLKRELN